MSTPLRVIQTTVKLTRHNLAGYRARERHGRWDCGCHFVDAGYGKTLALEICDEVLNRDRSGAALLVPDANYGPPLVAPDPRALEFA